MIALSEYKLLEINTIDNFIFFVFFCTSDSESIINRKTEEADNFSSFKLLIVSGALFLSCLSFAKRPSTSLHCQARSFCLLREMPADAKVVANLLDDMVWALNSDVEDHYAKLAKGSGATDADAADAKYLAHDVFPTLVPALHELLQLVVKHEEQRKATARLPAVPVTSSSAATAPGLPDYGPTAHTHPVDWLAQYLFRNNPKHSKALQRHPYCVISKQVLEKQESAAE
jgi:hypothetical protein